MLVLWRGMQMSDTLLTDRPLIALIEWPVFICYDYMLIAINSNWLQLIAVWLSLQLVFHCRQLCPSIRHWTHYLYISYNYNAIICKYISNDKCLNRQLNVFSITDLMKTFVSVIALSISEPITTSPIGSNHLNYS